MTDHNPDCDVNDLNCEGIRKPCNCCAGQSLGPTHGSRLFGGEDSDQYNAMHDALVLAAADYALTVPDAAKRGTDTKSAIYQFVEETPATSLVIELTNALNTLGWQITPRPRDSANK
jgi:hypothetical protein